MITYMTWGHIQLVDVDGTTSTRTRSRLWRARATTRYSP